MAVVREVFIEYCFSLFVKLTTFNFITKFYLLKLYCLGQQSVFKPGLHLSKIDNREIIIANILR